MKSRAVIFDVDGTLCDVSNVRWHVDLKDPRNRGFKDFNSFHEAAAGEPPHKEIVGLTHALAPDIARIVVTARKRMWEKHTVWWLLLNGVRFDWLFMRRDDDGRKDFFVKEEILERIESRYEVVYAIDDNPAVIALWERKGIPTLVVPGWVDEGETVDLRKS